MAYPVIGVEIDGVDVTADVMSATWRLGIDGFLSDIGPNTASVSFRGQVTAAPGDELVITSDAGDMWTGRVDSNVETRDNAGDYWTVVTGTDLIGTLGSAQMEGYNLPGGGIALDAQFETMALDAGITLFVVDHSTSGLPAATVSFLDPFSGSVLEYANAYAKGSNAMLATQPDGRIRAVVREALLGAADAVSNPGFETNTTGWSAVLGGTINRITATPYAGVAHGRIVSSATQYSGASHTMTGVRFLKGHTYRLSLAARRLSGSTSVNFGLGQGADRTASVITLTGSWATYTVDWTPTTNDTFTAVQVDLWNDTAATNTFEIDEVYVYEIDAGVLVGAVDVSADIITITKSTSIDVDINRWVASLTGGGNAEVEIGDDAADISAYGERTFDASSFVFSNVDHFDDWIALGGSQRPIVTAGELQVQDGTSDLLTLAPFDWIDDGTDQWQLMSLAWTAEPGKPWRISITADNLLALL